LRVSAAVLALIVGAQGIGKLFDMPLYRVALDRFRAFPTASLGVVSVLWVAVEIVGGIGLLGFAFSPSRKLLMLGATLALVDTVAYAALTIGTRLRGIEVANCTCFGVYMPQRLSTSVLVQDLVMLAWAGWTCRAALRWPP
jgi:hypothetical protein